MEYCAICGEFAFGQPNKEVTCVVKRANNDGSLSESRTETVHPLLEPETPPLCYLHLKMELGLLDPATTDSAWLLWRKERERSKFATPRSLRQLEEVLAKLRTNRPQAFHDDENSAGASHEARD